MKKLILFIAIGLWLISPCLASLAAVTNHKTNSKTHPNTHHSRHAGKHIKHNAHKKSKKKHHRKKSHRKSILPNDRTALVDESNFVEPKPPANFFSSMEQRLVGFVQQTVASLRYSAYKLGGTHFDTSHGIYILDCSDYIDHILEKIYPNSYFNLIDSTGADKPTTQHYYDFFSALDEEPSDYWHKVDDVEQLQAGDILVFRYKNSFRRVRGGHVMIVMDKPIRDENAFLVRVADSAPAGHSQDTRPWHVSGIGIGTLLLKASPETGHPLAYAWRIGARWNKNVNIAMARPMVTS